MTFGYLPEACTCKPRRVRVADNPAAGEQTAGGRGPDPSEGLVVERPAMTPSPDTTDDELADHLAVAIVAAGNPKAYRTPKRYAVALVRELRRYESR